MMPILILCGGKATRLGELTKDTPKYLVDVCGKPFAWWQLSLLREQGYRDIVLLTGHFHDQIRATIGDGSDWCVNVRYQRDVMPNIGPHGAILWSILPCPFFVLYGDSYLECDYEEIEGRFRTQRLDALLTRFNGVDYGLRAFQRYPPRHATYLEMPQSFKEIGSHAGLAELREYLPGRNYPNRPDDQSGSSGSAGIGIDVGAGESWTAVRDRGGR